MLNSPLHKLLVALFCLSLPISASARTTSFDTLNYRPATEQGLYLTLYGTDSLEPYQWTGGFLLDYARSPLSQADENGNREPIVRDLLGGHATGAVGILPWLELGLNPNFVLMEKFFDPTTRAESTRLRMGETRFNAKFQILNKKDRPIGLAFIPYLDIPTGSGASFVGNNSFAGGGNFAVETNRIEERLSFALNLGYYTRDRVLVLQTPFDDLLTFGAAGNFLVVRWMELVAEFHGGTMVSDPLEGAGSPFEGGGGAKFLFGPDRRWQLIVGVSSGIGSGLGNPTVRGMAGLSYTPARPVRGVELQESVTDAFTVFELQDRCPFEVGKNVLQSDPACQAVIQELSRTCPDKKKFNPKKDDPRCLKYYLSQ